jgi:4-cresol dehydrogenase (hydroxylating)
MTIVYSRTIPGEESRARDLYGALRARIRGMGYEQYRVGLWSMGEAMEGSAGRRHMARAIKDAVDPAGILAPGKYGI